MPIMTTPMEVWSLIERADERIKYAQNRDAAAAYAQARESLDRAAELAGALEDPRARAGLTAQIERRRRDLAELEAQ